MKTSTPRIILLSSLVLLAGIVILIAATRPSTPDWASATPEMQAILWPGARDVADFNLLDQHGRAFGKGNLEGRWSLLYFGFLQCPAICPTTLQSLSMMRKLMADAGQATELPQMIFVSVDPKNDTPERIAPYLAFFNKDLVGLSGEPNQLARLARSLGIIYVEQVEPNGMRTMGHTTSVIVVDPQGRGVAALAGSHQPRVMLRQFNVLTDFLSG